MRRMRVLIFDDETDVLFLFKLILNKRGHEVFTCENCHTLIETVSFIRPDLIFMDYSMPGITGYEATQKLKQTQTYSDIPIILCSAHIEAEQLAQNAKADLFLAKPFSVIDLEHSIGVIQAMTG